MELSDSNLANDKNANYIMTESTKYVDNNDIEGNQNAQFCLSTNCNILTEVYIGDVLGIYDLQSTKELILRDANLNSIDENCAKQLSFLEILSLSHNKLSCLSELQHCTNLIEANFNFNIISSLTGLQCYNLEKLYLAHNKISDISPLKAYQKLTTISLYGNRLRDFNEAMCICRQLLKLRDLDLGDNPCTRHLDGYRFQVIHSLQKLEVLDGDQITQLEKDLALEFYISNGKPTTEKLLSVVNPSVHSSEIDSPGISGISPGEIPRGNIQLFRDEFLNSNPILLEYLATDAQLQPCVNSPSLPYNDSESHISDAIDYRNQNPVEVNSRPASAGFVEKLRQANQGNHYEGLTTDEDESPVNKNVQSLNSLGTVVPPAPVLKHSTSRLSIDPSDPNATIRKLLKYIENLQNEMASHQTVTVQSTSYKSLVEENQRLAIENNNIPILKDEIVNLKKQLNLILFESTSSNGAGPLTKRIKELEDENLNYQREVAKLKARLEQFQDQRESQNYNQAIQSATPMRLSGSELLDESASIDIELTELILQNEIALDMIRHDIKSTQREWDTAMQQAKEEEVTRVRPSTSAGCYNRTPMFKASPMTNDLISDNFKISRRELHTSAGTNRISELESHTFSSSRSTINSNTNILQL